MAGHSKWATTKRAKGVKDAKRGKVFTKLAGHIAIAAKSGGDPAMNPSLALAIEKAKAANMPNTNIDKAIKRGTGELGGDAIEEYTFEGYGPEGVGIIIEGASDNRNRITSEVRAAFSKNGGNIAEPGSVMFQFERKGVIVVDASGEDALLELLDTGADDAEESDGEIILYTAMSDLAKVRDAVKALDMPIKEDSLQYIPNNMVTIEDEDKLAKIEKLIEAIEDVDDVTETFSNHSQGNTKDVIL